jgi:hypothetical protein
MRSASLSVALGLVLAGCSANLADVPSLKPRPIEHRPILPPDPASEPQTPVTPALEQHLAKLVADATAGHEAFEKERSGNATVLEQARGAAEGSEAWIAGQQALSALDAARAQVRDAAGAIDTLRVDPAYVGTGDRAAIEAAAEKVAGFARDEAAAVDKIGG